MKLTMRKFQDEEDFWRMRALAREAFLLNDRLERSWSTPRLDYWRWHYITTVGTEPMEKVTNLWENTDGHLVAAVYTIASEVYLITHPHYRNAELEHEMYLCAEVNLFTTKAGDQPRLYALADEDDPLRQAVLAVRGYIYRDRPVCRWLRDLMVPLPEITAAPGYIIRSMGDVSEHERRSWASWRAFHPDEPDEDYEGGDWFANLQSAPSYRRDLDIVAEAPNGEIAAFATLFYDDATRSAVCVLMGVVAEHQRRGLGKAVLTEGLRRARQMGCTRAFANGFDPPANALYGSVLGTSYRAESWFLDLHKE